MMLYTLVMALTEPPVMALFWCCVCLVITNDGPLAQSVFVMCWTGLCVLNLSLCLIFLAWIFAIGTVLSFVMALWFWWRMRRKPRGALGFLGYKAKALRASLVRKVREHTAPRRSRYPAPQGA